MKVETREEQEEEGDEGGNKRRRRRKEVKVETRGGGEGPELPDDVERKEAEAPSKVLEAFQPWLSFHSNA